MSFKEKLSGTHTVAAATMQTNSGLDQRGKIASRTDGQDKSRDSAASYLRFVNYISDPLDIGPFLQLYAKIYFRLGTHDVRTKDLADVYYSEAADLEKVACQLGGSSVQLALLENNIDYVIGDEPVAFCDEIKSAFGFADAGFTEQKNAHVEHTDQYAMQLTFRGACVCLRFGYGAVVH